MKKSHELSDNRPNGLLVAGAVAAVAISGSVLYPNVAEAAEKQWVSPEEQAILAADKSLDAIIASPNSRLIFQKQSNGKIETQVVNGSTTVTKQDGKYVDAYNATKVLPNGSVIFETIVRDETPGDSAYFFVLGYQNAKGKTIKSFTYSNGAFEPSQAEVVVGDIIRP